MAYTLRKSEVILNGTRFRLTRQVEPVLTATFPAKQVFGEYGRETDPNVSSVEWNDQRGGILLAEGSAKELNRCWWSDCIIDQKGHLGLPREETSITVPTITSTSPNLLNGNMEQWSGNDLLYWSETNHSKETFTHEGSYSLGLAGGEAYQDVSWSTSFQGRWFTFLCWVYASAPSLGQIYINDGVTTTYSAHHPGDSTWRLLGVSMKLSASATRLRVGCIGGNSPTPISYFDDASLYGTSAQSGAIFANFASGLWMATGNSVLKLDTGGTAFEVVFEAAPSTITALVPSIGNLLYVFAGDSKPYCTITASGTVTWPTSTDVNLGATLAAQWDAKLFKMTSAGTCLYSAAPNEADPTWTAAGNINDVSGGAIKRLFVGFDASGEDVLYASTRKGLKVLDFDNGLWLDTALAIADHPNGGSGAGRWREGQYVSAGLELYRYLAGYTARIDNIGLNQDDGLPSEYNGEITALTTDYVGRLFCGVDSTQVSGTHYSFVGAWNGQGWSVWWCDTVSGRALHDIIVSSAVGYRLYVAIGSLVYAIDVPRGVYNFKVAGQTYKSSGTHIYPWFDAGWAVGVKTALALTIKTSNPTTDETVVVSYRIDHTYTDLSSGWTTLATITTSGEHSYTFGTGGVGIPFKSIQIRLQLARGSTTTNTPDVEWVALSYMLTPQVLQTTGGGWGYRLTVDCSEQYRESSPPQLYSALIAAAEASRTQLIPFSFREDEEYLGRIVSVEGAVESGELKEGQFTIFIIVP